MVFRPQKKWFIADFRGRLPRPCAHPHPEPKASLHFWGEAVAACRGGEGGFAKAPLKKIPPPDHPGGAGFTFFRAAHAGPAIRGAATTLRRTRVPF